MNQLFITVLKFMMELLHEQIIPFILFKTLKEFILGQKNFIRRNNIIAVHEWGARATISLNGKIGGKSITLIDSGTREYKRARKSHEKSGNENEKRRTCIKQLASGLYEVDTKSLCNASCRGLLCRGLHWIISWKGSEQKSEFGPLIDLCASYMQSSLLITKAQIVVWGQQTCFLGSNLCCSDQPNIQADGPRLTSDIFLNSQR